MRKETTEVPARSHFKTDDLKTVLRLFIVHDGEVKMVVDRVSQGVRRVLLHQQTSDGIASLVVDRVIVQSNVHDGRKIVDQNLRQVLIIYELDKLLNILVTVILLTNNCT